jgi:hypothetical protein
MLEFNAFEDGIKVENSLTGLTELKRDHFED